LSPVGTSSWLSPLPMTVIAWEGTPSRTRASLTALARRNPAFLPECSLLGRIEEATGWPRLSTRGRKVCCGGYSAGPRYDQ
jgi:hypothetical protein